LALQLGQYCTCCCHAAAAAAADDDDDDDDRTKVTLMLGMTSLSLQHLHVCQ